MSRILSCTRAWCGAGIQQPAQSGLAIIGAAMLVLSGLACGAGSQTSPLVPVIASSALSFPVVYRITPSSGASTGGTPVTLVGSGFSSLTQVDFGKATATLVDASDNLIVVDSPPGAGTVVVTVVTAAGRSAVRASDRFTYLRRAMRSRRSATSPAALASTRLIKGFVA